MNNNETVWKFATEAELEHYEILRNEGISKAIFWLYENNYLNVSKLKKEFAVEYNDMSTLLVCLENKICNNK